MAHPPSKISKVPGFVEVLRHNQGDFVNLRAVTNTGGAWLSALSMVSMRCFASSLRFCDLADRGAGI